MTQSNGEKLLYFQSIMFECLPSAKVLDKISRIEERKGKLRVRANLLSFPRSSAISPLLSGSNVFAEAATLFAQWKAMFFRR